MDVLPLRPTAVQPVQSPAQTAREELAQARVVAAEVLQLGDGGSLVLGVGRERVAATSQAALQVGQKVLLELRGAGSARVLAIVGEELAGASAKAGAEDHPFRWLARGQGLGELLADLAAALSARGARAPALATELAWALGQFAFEPGASGAALAQHLSHSGLAHEARSLARALDGLPGPVLAAAAEELVQAAFRALPHGEGSAALRAELAERLAQLAGGADASAAARADALVAGEPGAGDARALRVWLEAALEHLGGRPLAPEAQAELVARLMLARLSPRLARAVLRALLGARAPAALARDIVAGPPLENAAADLKPWLREAAHAMEPGPERAALKTACEALEAEQFVALARADRGDGACFAFALRDGAGFADARLVHRRSQRRGGADAVDGAPAGDRAVLGIEFSRTGPVRADFGLHGSTLHVRIGVARVEVAERLNAALGLLRERLAVSGRNVLLSVQLRPADELRVPGAEVDEHLSDGRAAVDRVA